MTFMMALSVMFNPKLAWANPTAQIPDWIKLRMRPLSDDERQEYKTIEKIGDTLLMKQQLSN